MIGEDGILKELELAGFQYLGGPVSRSPKSLKSSYSPLFIFLFLVYSINQKLCY